MRKAQTRRLALWINGQYMLAADHNGVDEGLVSGDDLERITEAQGQIGHEMIRRSGIPHEATQAEAVRMVLAGERVTYD